MSENLHSDPTMRMMYNDALLDLMAGAVNQIDKEVLSYTPLPDSVIDPYVSQEVQAKAAMELTYSSLSTWIDEAKKASYFTKHFVVLSKMINNGVASMARGLATLHACGEDLSVAPMSVQDLIMVASYHIRKSYLGVMQTSRSHPEIGEQLVLNQLGWTNTLLRLFKTKRRSWRNRFVRIRVPGLSLRCCLLRRRSAGDRMMFPPCPDPVNWMDCPLCLNSAGWANFRLFLNRAVTVRSAPLGLTRETEAGKQGKSEIRKKK